MTYVTGWSARKIKATRWRDYVQLCRHARADGYELHKATTRWRWPRFWIREYRAVFRKYYIIDDRHMAYFSKQQIEYIKTGKT